MTLSTKSTTAYVVMATWAGGQFETWTYRDEINAESIAKKLRKTDPEAHVQIHRIEQRLPKEEK